MALIDLAHRVYDSGEEFEMRIAAAAWTYALVVLAEAGSVADHANRLLWAKACLQDGRAMARRMKPIICSNATVLAQGNTVSDADLQWVTSWAVDNALGLLT